MLSLKRLWRMNIFQYDINSLGKVNVIFRHNCNFWSSNYYNKLINRQNK